MKECEIVYENGSFWVRRAKNGFEVYEAGITHSVRRAIIGYEGQAGLERAKAEADRRASVAVTQHQRGSENV